MVNALYESNTQNEFYDYDNLPETAKKLINQGLEDINEGRVHAHEDVMAEFRKNIILFKTQ
jgi:predicted transcriptional regulator